KVVIHLSVQNSLSQSLLQLPKQTIGGKHRLRIVILQQLVENLFLDRHTLPPGLKYGSDTKNQTLPAYWNESHRQAALAAGIRYRINRRSPRRPLSKYQRFINRRRSAARARVEHVFHVVKRLWGFSKVRYRGLAKNTVRLYTAFALANLYLLR